MQTAQLQDALQHYFGFSTFRGSQEEIIQRTLEGEDSLVIMPTGGGKSICYQLPSLLMDGLTIVVSPLIALMKDQVESMRANGIAAASLNSSVSQEASANIKSQIARKQLKLLYVSPERAVSEGFLSFIGREHVNLIAIDEAHCVSMWGNDFRPEYTKLHKLNRLFPHAPHLALTATADTATQADISKQLGLKQPKLFLASFERPNITIKVQPAHGRWNMIRKFISSRPDEPGIVYCLSRKSTEELAEKLNASGIKAAHYHAQLPGHERDRVQQAFQKDDIQVVCATIAFGMGVDKSNIRWVIHYNMPKNIESYYQEIGRAGRDGAPAQALLFFGMNDFMILRKFVTDSQGDQTFKDVQLAKLQRMLEFCQATSCRTNIILHYFGEHRDNPCQHCDRCKNPPKGFDGTIIAQKALSACMRTNENVAMTILSDILRGSQREEIRKHGYHQIKTFGAGKDISRQDWLEYIIQLTNLGLIAIDYTDRHTLKITEAGKDVLFNNKKVSLVQPQAAQLEQKSTPVRSRSSAFNEELFQLLRTKRKQMADKRGVAPYIIFSDQVLEDMVTARPIVLEDLTSIPGIGDYKRDAYGQEFIEAIREYIHKQDTLKSVKGKTYIETLKLYQKGFTPEEIATHRKLNPLTIYSHLAGLFERGENIPIHQYVSMEEIDAVNKAWLQCGKSEQLSEIKQLTLIPVEFYKIRLIIALLKKQE